MPAANHPDYKEELERCKYTLQYVKKSLEETTEKKDRIEKDLDRVKRHFNADSSQSYIDMIINSQLAGSVGLKVRNLVTAKNKPYFARIDFSEAEKSEVEKLYIGKMSLMREEDQEMIIVDWRAPISNLYYEGRLGEAEYESPGGTVKGDLELKRQFSIDEGKLNEIFDIDITTNDEFLQTYLGANADNRLKEIVSTIQVEQNEIVRADMWRPLIVQGAAGSGKTTIALHRIAYLIYTFEKTFEPENFMIIAPNMLFLNYISEVLPELGVERVKQTTFEDFAMELIGKKFKLREANEKLTAFVNNNASEEDRNKNNLIKKTAELKSSMLFKNILDDYLKIIEENFIPQEDFKIGTKVIYTYKEINDLFLNEYKRWPIVQRVVEIRKHLTNRLKVQKNQIINQINEETDKKTFRIKMTIKNLENRQTLLSQAIEKKDAVLSKLDTVCKKAVKEYEKTISKFSPYQYYEDLISNEEMWNSLLEGRVDPAIITFAREYSYDILKTKYIELEDLAPIIYLKYCIYGMDEKIPVRHIVVDEAQDFSAFQFYVIRKIVKDSSFTILGDLAQGIHSYRGVKNWEDIRDNVFDDRKCQLLTLEQSYRTTVEIMEAANKVIGRVKDKNFIKAQPVIRHGEEVRIIKKDSIKDIAEEIKMKIQEFTGIGLKTIAIICKTLEECKTMQNLLKKVENIHLLTGKEDYYQSGIVIVPSYLSKGLEFDAVLIVNANDKMYTEDELDIKLLYVSMTRSLHKLYIYFEGKPSPLLEDV